MAKKEEYTFKKFKELTYDSNGKLELDKDGNPVYHSVTRLVDKDDKLAPAAFSYVYRDISNLDAKPVTVEIRGKPVPVNFPCTDCKGRANVFALIVHGEARCLCVQCLGELAGRWLSVVHAK